MASGQWAAAIEAVGAALAREPGQMRLHDLRVRIALRRGLAKPAREALANWASNLPEGEEVNPVRIQATEELERALRLPDRAAGTALIVLASSLQATSQWADAAREFRRFGSEFKDLGDPVYTPAYALLQAASCLRALGENAEARELYDEIILFWTTSPEAKTAQAAMDQLPPGR